jgi:hypothetical protein
MIQTTGDTADTEKKAPPPFPLWLNDFDDNSKT